MEMMTKTEMGVDDQDRDGVNDKDRDGVNDKDRDGVNDKDRDGVNDKDRDGVNDEDRDGLRNVCMLSIQPHDAASSLEYFIKFNRPESLKLHISHSIVTRYVTTDVSCNTGR